MIGGRTDFLLSWQQKNERIGVDFNELPQMPQTMMFGGLDLAERVDHTSLFGTKWNGKKLRQHGAFDWPHVKYPQISEDIHTINEKINFDHIGFDETGVGIGVAYLFNENLPMEPVTLSNPTKLDAVGVVKFLFQAEILEVERSDSIVREIEQQEKVISDSGNRRYEHPSGSHDDRFWALAINCYIAVPYIIGLPPASIESYVDEKEEMDIDLIERDVLSQYTNSGYGHSW